MWSKYVGKAGTIIHVKAGLAGTRRFIMLGNQTAGYFYMDDKAARQLIGLIEKGLGEIEAEIAATPGMKRPS